MPETSDLLQQASALFGALDRLAFHKRVQAFNALRRCLQEHSPFADEPVDCVQWVPCEQVEGNDYNPNSVAPPEMKLLALSIANDGFTQPVVVHEDQPGHYVVVDGFHRQRVARKTGPIRQRLHGYVPVVTIRSDRNGRADRIASTIRHNRARGVHGVLPMTDVVVTLLRAGWSDADVQQALGMDADEVLRFKQVSGLPELFRDQAYSMSWE